MHSTQENVAESLALVNVVRQAFGAEMLTELPDSQKGNSSDCLYYRALKDVGVQSVGGDGGMSFADERTAAVVAGLWGTEANGSYVKAPEQFGQVIGEFDGGKLGHYTL
jgi:hypothetical protein